MQKHFFANFQKVEENDDGTVRVYGIASTETKDHDGEVIKASAVRMALPDWMKFGNIREMHQPIAAGTAIEASVDDSGVTHLGALIVDPATVKKVKAGVLKGFSLGGKVTKRNAKDKSIIEGIRLTEISVVDRPANPDALITLAKMDSAGRRKSVPASAESDDPLAKSLWDVGELARLIICLSGIQNNAVYEAANEGDGSLMAAKLKIACQSLVECLREMVDEETRELLGGMLDVASVAKAITDKDLLKTDAGDAMDAERFRALLVDTFESLGLKKAATITGESAMTDELKKAVADAVAEQTATLKKSVDDLTTSNADMKKSLDTLTTENTDLKTKLAKAETDRDTAQKLADDIAKAAVEKGIVKAVSKADDTGTPAPAAPSKSDPLAKGADGKPDVNAEMKRSFARPLSPVRGL